MNNHKKQMLALTLGLALSSIALASPYCMKKASEVSPQNKEKLLEICKHIDKYNKILKEADITKEAGIKERYDISEPYFINLIMQGNQAKVQEYLNNYKKDLNDLYSRECDERVHFCGLPEDKNEMLSILKTLENLVYTYLK